MCVMIVHRTGDVCGVGRIPYSQPQKMKAIAVGSPAGVDFKQPAMYKAEELRLVYNGLSSFRFIRLCTGSTDSEIGPTESEVV